MTRDEVAMADLRPKVKFRPGTNRPVPAAPPLLWDVRGVARALGLGVRTVWRLSSAGELPPPISIGRSKRWERRRIEAWLAAKVAERKRR